MYRDPWNSNNTGDTPRAAYQSRNPQCRNPQPRTAQPRLPRLDTARFNEAAKAFFETWRPPAVRRGTMPVPRVLTGFEYSANGYLMANYANPVSQSIEAWGLDVNDFRNGRLNPRCFRS